MNRYERAVIAAQKKEALAAAALQRAQIALQKHCTHPDSARSKTTTESDDGYGRWYTRVEEQCRLCGQTRTYAGQGQWQPSSYYFVENQG